MPTRLFVAIVPPEPVRVACEAATRDLWIKMQPGGYRINPEKYHITMLYLGDALTEEQQMKAVQAGHLVRAEPFSLQLNMAGSFAANKKPPCFLNPGSPPEGLLKLRAELVRHYKAVGLQPDSKRFTPHLTVGRETHSPVRKTAIKPIPWDVTEFQLLRSPLLTRDHVYEEVARWPLREAFNPGEQGSLL